MGDLGGMPSASRASELRYPLSCLPDVRHIFAPRQGAKNGLSRGARRPLSQPGLGQDFFIYQLISNLVEECQFFLNRGS
jgi:hypothetical protein